ncbi:cytochrome P450 7B1 isoform X1 [Phycodurus eques]|uniref:cytochrome P450 7B1 isoform X1 n=2 Tax=Phycodurus eques TaxID=693459 RepID=UPI002ACEFF76|nr:cytochrome P450 7B1 isoform X1 [Phycodurus eques]
MFPPLACALLLVLALALAISRRKRRAGEPPLINGWIPFLGKALEFRKDAHKFLEEQQRNFGDVFTVHIAGRYMTFVMDPLMYPSVIKHGRQLDFHEFTGEAAPSAFGYPPVAEGKFPGLAEQIRRSFRLLGGDHLTPLTQSMMGNLMTLFRQDHLGPDGAWRTSGLYDFCVRVVFEATFLTVYGRPPDALRHADTAPLRADFARFDDVFPLLVARVPVRLLGRVRSVREKLIRRFLPRRTSGWAGVSRFVRRRAEILERHAALSDVDKAAHHFAMLWASVANTAPAAFWVAYHLLRQPEALRAVRREVRRVAESGQREFSTDIDVTLGTRQLDDMILLESAIKESLRLSSASINIRVAKEDFALRLNAKRSVPVRRGDIIALYPQSVHMDAGIYEDPQTFRLDRFAGKSEFFKDGHKLHYYLMPFGSGASICPGRFFAVNEIKQFLSLLLLYFDMQLEAGQPDARPDAGRAGLGILRPDRDVRFRYRLRRGAC